jgi:hypothetical protein
MMQRVTPPVSLFLNTCSIDNGKGISSIDSNPFEVFKNMRVKRNRAFKG